MGSPKKALRNEEMKRLRLEERLSLRDIGQRFDLSKQRVQVIVGKTGHMYTPQGKLINCESIPNVDDGIQASV